MSKIIQLCVAFVAWWPVHVIGGVAHEVAAARLVGDHLPRLALRAICFSV